MKSLSIALCSIMLSLLPFIASAQTDPEEKKYSNDIGFNTTFLLDGIFNPGQTPFTLMYKKYKDNNNPLRLGIRMNASLSDTKENAPSSYFNQSNFYVSAVVGKEYQKEINPNWVWYFGGDIVSSYNYFQTEYHSTSNGFMQTQTENKVGLGLMPFLGIRFNINSRLYLSTEFSFGPTYSYTWNSVTFANPTSTVQDTEISTFIFSMNPAYGLFLYYRF